jgi:hypothetical protein
MTASFPHTSNSGNRLNELFDRLVLQIQKMYGNQLTEQEAIEAARNWIGFCSKLQDIEKSIDNNRLELDCDE